jgi:hypothetical protein
MAKKFAELRERMIPDPFGVREAVSSEDPLQGRTWLQNEMPDDWNQRRALAEVLRYLSRGGEHLPGWKEVARAAALAAGAVENHHV